MIDLKFKIEQYLENRCSLMSLVRDFAQELAPTFEVANVDRNARSRFKLNKAKLKWFDGDTVEVETLEKFRNFLKADATSNILEISRRITETKKPVLKLIYSIGYLEDWKPNQDFLEVKEGLITQLQNRLTQAQVKITKLEGELEKNSARLTGIQTLNFEELDGLRKQGILRWREQMQEDQEELENPTQTSEVVCPKWQESLEKSLRELAEEKLEI